MSRPATAQPPAGKSVRSLNDLKLFLRPYKTRIALALLFLLMAALTTLVLPIALRTLIDQRMAITRWPGSAATMPWSISVRRAIGSTRVVKAAINKKSSARAMRVL